MKLRTSLQIGALFPIILALIVSLSLFLRSRELSATLSAIGAAQTVASTAEQLDEISCRLVFQTDKAALTQWPSRQDELATLIDGIQTEDASEQTILDRMRKALDAAKDAFAQIPSDRGAKQMSEATGALLLVQTRELVSLGFELAGKAANGAGSSQHLADTLFMVFIGVIGLMMAIDMLSISRQLFDRVSPLTISATAIAKGNLDHKTAVDKTSDEIGDLSSAFITMVEELKHSHAELQKEVEEHKRIAQSARDANVLLSDALCRLQTAQQQIVRQERLHALEQIAKGVTQNFDSTLLPIVGATDYLMKYPENLKNEKVIAEHIKTINEAAKRAVRNVGDLYEYFRPGKTAGGATISVNDLVNQAITLTQPLWDDASRPKEKTIRVRTDLNRVPAIAGDETDLRQVIVSLIMNSIEAVPDGGNITVSTATEGSSIVLKVTDDGVGMSDDVRRRCLEPFYTTKQQGATGMGLAVVSNVVRRHEGTVNIESERCKGTTMTIRLPVGKARQQEKAAPVNLKLAGSLKILVIDDEFTARELVARMLREDGHSVKTADGGQSALTEVRSSEFDVIIADQAMPDISGVDLVPQLREVLPDVKVMMLTGMADLLSTRDTRPKGVDILISKPVSCDELRAALAKIVSQK